MKWLLFILTFCLLSHVALAATEDTTSSIYDLQYLPRKGIGYGESQFQTAETTSKQSSFAVQTNATTYNQTVGYSFTNRILGIVNANYLFNSSTQVEGSVPQRSNGFSDPTFGARVRLVEQKGQGFNFDIVPKITVPTGDGLIGTTNNNGNNKIGGGAAELDLNLGKKFTTFQFNGFINTIFNGKADVKDATTKAKTKSDSYLKTSIGAQVLYNLSDIVFISAVGSYNYTQAYDTNNSLGLTKNSLTNSFTLGTELGCTPTPDLLIAFALNGTKIQNYSSSTPTGDLNVENKIISIIQLRARYQF
jgi:hypothetical protein